MANLGRQFQELLLCRSTADSLLKQALVAEQEVSPESAFRAEDSSGKRVGWWDDEYEIDC